jgi:hypothetical protein
MCEQSSSNANENRGYTSLPLSTILHTTIIHSSSPYRIGSEWPSSKNEIPVVCSIQPEHISSIVSLLWVVVVKMVKRVWHVYNT